MRSKEKHQMHKEGHNHKNIRTNVAKGGDLELPYLDHNLIRLTLRF